MLHVSRSALSPRLKQPPKRTAGSRALEKRVRKLIRRHPTFGYRRIWAMLRRSGVTVNKKTVYRLFRRKRWFVAQRIATPRPRAAGRTSITDASNVRWAMDVTHILCGRDGWGHLAAVIDCHDRELIGFEFALRGRAREAERALEAACIERFGTLRPEGATPVVRSDNGLIFQSRRFRAACRDYRLEQEFVTPYTPEQNGLIERFFRSLKEECVWQHRFESFERARREITRWIEWYNRERPHQSLGYLSPREFREQKALLVA